MTIDYSKLNDQIVKQAYVALDKTQVAQLIKDKTDRAIALHESQKVIARGSKYTTHR